MKTRFSVLRWVGHVTIISFLLLLLNGCGGDSSDGNGTSNSGGGSAPDSIAGRAFTVHVTSGAAPFSKAGSYVFTPDGASGATSGTYRLDGTGGPQDNTGVYTYDRTSEDTATVVMTEDVSGTVVNNVLDYRNTTSGTIRSTSNRGGFQNGTFVMH